MLHLILALTFLGTTNFPACEPSLLDRKIGYWDGARFVSVQTDGIWTSGDGFFWKQIAPLPVPGYISDRDGLFYNGSLYMLSYNAMVFASADLIDWEQVEVGHPGPLAWNGTHWLTYDYSGAASSTDGYHWNQVDLDFSPYGLQVFKGRFYVPGDPVVSSSDGLTWQAEQVSAIQLFDCGPTLAAVDRTNVFISSDGQTWEGGAVTTGQSFIFSMAFNGTTYVALGSARYTSTDGKTWSEAPMLSGANGVVVNQGKFFTLGQVWTSDNGSDWVNHSVYSSLYATNQSNRVYLEPGYLEDDKLFQYFSGRDFTYLNGLYFLSFGDLFVSSNGVGWVPVNIDTYGPIFYSQGHWECFTYQMRHRSQNGYDWVTEPFPEATSPVVKVNDRYFAFELTSLDGQTWEIMDASPTRIHWTGQDYLGQDHSNALRSSDGVHWTVTTKIPGYDYVVKDGVLASSADRLYISLDQGRNWFLPISDLPNLGAVNIYDDKFIAIGNGKIYSSQDGLYWEHQDLDADLTYFPVSSPNLLLAGSYSQRWRVVCPIGGAAVESQAVAVFPWVVANTTWYSSLGLMNYGPTAAMVTLEAEDREGQTQAFTTVIPSKGVFIAFAADLFPGLNGYSVTVYSSDLNLNPSLTTFNENPEAGTHSPAQAEGCLLGSLTSELLFAYLPGEDVPAIVLENMEPGAQATQVEFSLINEAGTVIAQVTQTLEGKQPFASTVADLFPGISLPATSAIRAQGPANAWLSGLTFDFNHLGQPAMDRAQNLHP